MFKVSEKDKEYRFGDSGPKYLMRGPRLSFGIVVLKPGQDFKKHYHPHMEENFLVLEGSVDIYVDGVKFACRPGDMVHADPNEAHYLINPSDAPVRIAFVTGPFTENDKVEVD